MNRIKFDLLTLFVDKITSNNKEAACPFASCILLASFYVCFKVSTLAEFLNSYWLLRTQVMKRFQILLHPHVAEVTQGLIFAQAEVI